MCVSSAEPRDAVAGARLLGPACDQGDVRACASLAGLHANGSGVPKDPDLAAKFLEVACNGNEASACIALADIRATVGKAAHAALLYGKACGLGDATGCRRIDVDAREVIATSR